MEIISLLIVGVIAGLLAGLLGVGGGVVIVPALVWVLGPHTDIPTTHLMHIAVGTSLATIVFTSVSSIIAHHRRGAVQWNIVWQLAPGIIVGAMLGAAIADVMPNTVLKTFFALFLLVISIQLGFGIQFGSQRQLPNWLGMNLVASIIGTISGIVGVGGGSLTVPFLAACQISIRHAVATSAACGFPIAVSGTLGFILLGWQEVGLPKWSTGYVYWPAFLAIVPTSLLFAPLGAKLTHILPVNVLKKFFALFLVAMSIKMLME